VLAKLERNHIVLVAEVDGGVVGFAGGGPARRLPEDGIFELYALNIDPPHWSRGVGSALLDAFCVWSVTVKAREVVLWVAQENARACRFYERRGWAWDGTVEDWNHQEAIVAECRYRKSMEGRSAAALR
jgi:GNAT superfamily N-acetyltransferase